jgi:hypothetical protein
MTIMMHTQTDQRELYTSNISQMEGDSCILFFVLSSQYFENVFVYGFIILF